MSIFFYEASDKQGNITYNNIEADSINHAKQIIKEKQLIIIKLEQKKDTQNNILSKFSKINISKHYIIEFTRQFATLLDSSLTVDKSLDILIKENTNKDFDIILINLKSDINSGLSLANSLDKYPKLFSNLYVSLVQAGQDSGNLNKIMLDLADYLEKQQQLQDKIKQALIYPAVIGLVSISIIIYLLTSIVPKIVNVFVNNKQSLPAITQALVFISNTIINYGYYIGLTFIALLLICKNLIKRDKVKYMWHNILLKIPFINKLIISQNIAIFTSTLSILTASSIPIIKALKSGANTVSNLLIKNDIYLAVEKVEKGITLSNALKNTYFPSIMSQLIAVGENSGKLPSMLYKISDNQTKFTNKYILFLTTIIEPLMIVFMGFIVLIIVMGVLLPIMDISQFIK